MNSRTRAKPLSPEERRTAILDAVVPLLLDRGAAATTAEMAEAAGIAEGTIFRVFPDKASLLHAALKSAFDPAPMQEALGHIDPDLSLRDQLVAATDSLAERFDRVTALMGVLRSIPHTTKPDSNSHQMVSEAMSVIVASLTHLLERHREQLVVEPKQAATVLRGLVFTNAHQMLTTGDRMRPAEIVDILLGGIAKREAH